MRKLWIVFGMAGLLGLATASDASAQCGWGRGRGWCRGQGGPAAAAAPAADKQGLAAAPAAKGQGQVAAEREQTRLRLRDGSCSACPAGCTNCDLCPRFWDGSCLGCMARSGVCFRDQKRLRDGSCGACPMASQSDGTQRPRRLRDGSCGTCPLR